MSTDATRAATLNAELGEPWRQLSNGDLSHTERIIAEHFVAHQAPITGVGENESFVLIPIEEAKMTAGSHPARPRLVIDEAGSGSTILVLHGGGGPDTVRPITAHLAATHHVMTPTLPGWDGAPRPEAMSTIGDYAQAYLDHLAGLGFHEVVAIGSSLGGWIAAELAVRDRDGVLAGVVLINAAGISSSANQSRTSPR
jgi:pimeloyl-ACP methyl ester carboxylesterase